MPGWPRTSVPTPPNPATAGPTRRLGNHEILVRLAAGGAANVFLVRDLKAPSPGRLLALKVLLPSLASNDDFINMFFTEARIAARLNHPNVVSIAGFGLAEGIHCLAMEYVFGASLSQVLKQSARMKRPLTVGVLLRITAAVCDALDYAHELRGDDGRPMGLVHRDVTPQNILVGFNGVPKLTDFGIAKATGRGWETQAGIVKGKFSYMSPEQALGKKVDRRSDIFCTGIVLWEALTGKELFKGTSPLEVIESIQKATIEPPSKVVPGLSSIVDPIVMKALKRSPRQRFQTAAEMKAEIEDLIRRAGVQIDTQTIAQEFKEIYGDVIIERANALGRALGGQADLDELARVFGAQRLRDDHLPVIPGGASNPDPLGLFAEAPDDEASLDEAIANEDSRSLPARQEAEFTRALPAVDIELDDPADDENDATREGIEDEEELLDFAADPSPQSDSERSVVGWEDHTRAFEPPANLLELISSADATLGFSTAGLLDLGTDRGVRRAERSIPIRGRISGLREASRPIEHLDEADRTDGRFIQPGAFDEDEFTMDAGRPGFIQEPLRPNGVAQAIIDDASWEQPRFRSTPPSVSPFESGPFDASPFESQAFDGETPASAQELDPGTFDHGPPTTLEMPPVSLRPTAARHTSTTAGRSNRPVPRAPSLDLAEVVTPRPVLEASRSAPPPPGTFSPPPPPPPLAPSPFASSPFASSPPGAPPTPHASRPPSSPPPAPRKLNVPPKVPTPLPVSNVAPPPLPPTTPQPLENPEDLEFAPPVARVPSGRPRSVSPLGLEATRGPEHAARASAPGLDPKPRPNALADLSPNSLRELVADAEIPPYAPSASVPPASPSVTPQVPLEIQTTSGPSLRAAWLVALALVFILLGIGLGVLFVKAFM
jgi:hypothetical protein